MSQLGLLELILRERTSRAARRHYFVRTMMRHVSVRMLEEFAFALIGIKSIEERDSIVAVELVSTLTVEDVHLLRRSQVEGKPWWWHYMLGDGEFEEERDITDRSIYE